MRLNREQKLPNHANFLNQKPENSIKLQSLDNQNLQISKTKTCKFPKLKPATENKTWSKAKEKQDTIFGKHTTPPQHHLFTQGCFFGSLLCFT